MHGHSLFPKNNNVFAVLLCNVAVVSAEAMVSLKLNGCPLVSPTEEEYLTYS